MKDAVSGARLNEIWKTITGLPIKRRKQVVLLCRAQEVIFGDPYNLLAIQAGLTLQPDSMELVAEEKRFYAFVHSITDYIRSPIFSSVILDMCRSTPLGQSEIHDAKWSSWGKEIAVCERQERDLHLNYDCWFSQESYDRPLIVGTPANPAMARRIHSALLDWKRQVKNSLIYPRMSRKSVSRSTVRDWESIFDRQWVSDGRDGGVDMTQETLERIHHRDAVVVLGCCEIRQKWYKSGLAPRSYFTSGGLSYQKSKYIQEIAGLLTQQLETTHPITRLNPARVQLRGIQRYLRIYDLSVFTSNHWECKHFLDRLALWCSGEYVSVVDPVEGLIQVDLGDLISDYNQHMNYFAEYSMERIDHDFFEVHEFHNQAGFLGVYGNINFSTFVHGASLLMRVQEDDEANVAGDDAHYSEEHGMEDVSDRIILANGLFEDSKLFRADQKGAVCLKRGVTQVEGRVYPKQMLVFPSFSNLGELFGYTSPQFPLEAKIGKSPIDMVGAELFRFLRGLFVSGISDDLDLTYDLLESIYNAAHLPKAGSLPPYGVRLIPALPDTPASLIQISPLELLLHNHFSEGAVLPKFLESEDMDGSRDPYLVVNSSWSGSSTKKLRYLEVLGYVVREEQTEVLWGINAYRRLIDVFSSLGTKVYTFTVIEDVPDFLAELPSM